MQSKRFNQNEKREFHHWIPFQSDRLKIDGYWLGYNRKVLDVLRKEDFAREVNMIKVASTTDL